MRTLRFFFISLAILGVIAVVGLLITREVLLFIAINQVKSSLTMVRRQGYVPGTPSLDCQTAGQALLAEQPLVNVFAVQLAFQDDRTFQWELVCESNVREPQILNSYTLPPLVTKLPGSAGLLWKEPFSAFTLTALGRQRSVILENQDLRVQEGAIETSMQEQPISTCQGLGYACCQSESQIGQGDVADQVVDCPLSCYARCMSRPVILSLNSNPYIDPQTRSIEIASGETLAISYVVDPGVSSRSLKTELVFGDGDVAQGTADNATIEHLYRCPVGVCEYQVVLRATDQNGATSVDSSLARMTVRVTAR